MTELAPLKRPPYDFAKSKLRCSVSLVFLLDFHTVSADSPFKKMADFTDK